jgi:hypothetical protein
MNERCAPPFPFGLSLSFDKLRMIGKATCKHFDKLSANGYRQNS